MQDLFTRLFLNFRTSIDGAVLAILAWLGSQGVEFSDANKMKLTALAALLTAAVWKLFSKDPEPPRDSSK